jgi:hypothetical protein
MSVMEFLKGGIRLHEVVADDPLELGSVKIDTNEWISPANKDARYYPPEIGQLVIVAEWLEDRKLYWFGVFGEDITI